MCLCLLYDAGLICTKTQISDFSSETKSIEQVRKAFSYKAVSVNILAKEFTPFLYFSYRFNTKQSYLFNPNLLLDLNCSAKFSEKKQKYLY